MAAVIPIKSLVSLFAVLLLCGVTLSVPLFNFSLKKFISSGLFIKILFWIPIFIIFLGVLYANNTARLVLLFCLLLAALIEYLRIVYKSQVKMFLSIFFAIFVLCMSHYILLEIDYQSTFVSLLIVLCFASVLSDVSAFFFGNYLGRHKLPAVLNNKKSWEGVFGQLLGALIGVLLINTFVLPVVTLWLFLPLGIGSALGDLGNSFIKRKAGIKDWSHAIPGHGGFIDRLSSLAGSVMLIFYFMRITGLS